MSEFTCINGHILCSGELKCPECGGKLARMDGFSRSELRAMENDTENDFWNKCDHEYDREQEEENE